MSYQLPESMVRIQGDLSAAWMGSEGHLSPYIIPSPSSPGIWALPVNQTHLGATLPQLTRDLHGERGPWGPQTGQQARLPFSSRLLGQAAAFVGSGFMLYAMTAQGSYLISISSESQSRVYNEQVMLELTQCPRVCPRCPPAVPGFLEQLSSLLLMAFL